MFWLPLLFQSPPCQSSSLTAERVLNYFPVYKNNAEHAEGSMHVNLMLDFPFWNLQTFMLWIMQHSLSTSEHITS